jgi:hypothetical protein
MPHTPGSATYPTSTIAPDPYPKMPLSGAQTFTAEPQEMPMQPTSMGPSVQLPLSASHDPHQHQHQHHQHAHQQQPQPPIRTQFATYTSAPPHHLSLSSTTGTTSPDNSLAVPRYIGDTNPRPSKSPRHASHQSVTSSISNETASGEYRYGPPPQTQGGGYPAPETSPQSQHPALPPPPQIGGGQQGAYSQDGGASQPAGAGPGGQAPPPRDYFPTSQGWTTTAGGGGDAAGGPGQGVERPYGYPTAAGGSGASGHHHGVKAESHPHAGAGAAQTAPQGGYGYAWNTA